MGNAQFIGGYSKLGRQLALDCIDFGLSAAQAEFDIAQAEVDAVQRQLPAELAIATNELRVAQLTQVAAQQRLRLSAEVQTLITNSWRLGDSEGKRALRKKRKCNSSGDDT